MIVLAGRPLIIICFILSHPKQLSQGEPKDSKPRSWSWEFNHVTALMIVRIYYRGLDLDPEVFAATAPRVVEVPGTKPVNMRKAAGLETAELSVNHWVAPEYLSPNLHLAKEEKSADS